MSLDLENFRVVTFDYPLGQLDSAESKSLMSDLIWGKQGGFLRTSEQYIVLDKHDMIGTHIMIYDIRRIYGPKLVLAIRLCFENRAQFHGVQLPVENYIDSTSGEIQEKFCRFRQHRSNLVDCNSWFVDADYSFAKTGLPLSEVGFFFSVLHILRKGCDHFVGASNERFKASRWVSKVGFFEPNLTFVHPLVPDKHQFYLMESFSKVWLLESWERFGSLIRGHQEVFPSGSFLGEGVLSLMTVKESLEQESLSQAA